MRAPGLGSALGPPARGGPDPEPMGRGDPETGLAPPDPDDSGGETETRDVLSIYLEQIRRRKRLLASGDNEFDPHPPNWKKSATNGSPASDPAEGAGTHEGGCDGLVERNLDLAVSVAGHYRGFGIPLEDLIQEGNLGLLSAASTFRPGCGKPFREHARKRVRAAICRALSTRARPVHIPEEVLRLRRQAHQVLHELDLEAHEQAGETGRYTAPTVRDCATRIGVTEERLQATIAWLRDWVSLDAPGGRDAETLLSVLGDPRQETPEDRAAGKEAGSILREAVGDLPERLGLVIRRHYGFHGQAPAGFAEIGRELEVSRERVRQLHNDALAHLRRGVGIAAN